MKPKGLGRLQKFLEKVQANNTAEKRGDWVQPITSALQQELAHNVTRYHTQQCLNLDKVWKYVIQQLENAISHQQVLVLIQNIIRFIYLPDTLETFFSGDQESQHALLTLHVSLQTKLRQELVAGLDELFLGCNSAADFLDTEPNTSVYKVLDEIIKKVNKYEKQLKPTQPINIHNSSKRISSQSFSNIAVISLKPLPYLSALVNQENIEREEDCKVNYSSSISNISNFSLPGEIIAELFQEKEQYQEPHWMFEGLTLSANLIEDLKNYQEHLYKRFIANNQPHSKIVEHKLAFLDTIIYQAQNNKLTPKSFYQAGQNKPGLFSATFKSNTEALWLRVKTELIENFWKNVAQKSRIPFGYRITNPALLQKLKTKQQDFAPIPKVIDYKTLPKTSRARWYLEKRAALDHILYKQDQGTLCAEDFNYVFEEFSCLSATKLRWLRCSETESLINKIKDFIKNLLWVDAGGEGSTAQQKIRIEQQTAACLPTDRRALWAGNSI